MAKNPKDHAFVVVVDKLTKSQAGELAGEFAKAKNKVAPNARATGGMTTRENIGKLLQGGFKKLTGQSSKDDE